MFQKLVTRWVEARPAGAVTLTYYFRNLVRIDWLEVKEGNPPCEIYCGNLRLKSWNAFPYPTLEVGCALRIVFDRPFVFRFHITYAPVPGISPLPPELDFHQ